MHDACIAGVHDSYVFVSIQSVINVLENLAFFCRLIGDHRNAVINNNKDG